MKHRWTRPDRTRGSAFIENGERGRDRICAGRTFHAPQPHSVVFFRLRDASSRAGMRGFSLIEMIVVSAIILLIGVIAVLNFDHTIAPPK